METGLKVCCVFKVTNPEQTLKFQAIQARDEHKYSLINDQEGFHVTRAIKLDELIAQGFDQRLASKGRFGRGIYFAEDPCKADSYWPEKASKNTPLRMMLKVRLTMGRTKIYPSNHVNPSLLREPKGFDSVEGLIHNNKEYVIYNNDRANIEYIITYVKT